MSSTIHNPQSTIHNPQSTIHNPQPTTRAKTRRRLSLLAGCIGLLSLPLSSWAANVSFEIVAGDGQSTITKTDAGLTLTLQNPKCGTTAQPFKVDTDGIKLEPPNPAKPEPKFKANHSLIDYP